jgi:hypothetical protein
MKDTLADNNEAVLFLEKQLEKDAPDLDSQTRRTLARMGASIAIKEAKKTEQKSASPEKTKEKKEKSVQLDFWEDGKRAAPNAVFRSALFPALNAQQKESRRFLDQEKLFSTGGLEVKFTGKQFDQSDLDVYLELLNMARPYPLGHPVKFSAYGLLKALGLPTGGSNHARLHSVLIRLRGGTIDITDHKIRYFGGLIEGGIRDEISLNYEITINPKFADLFGFGMWATIDKEQRRSLGRSATAKALHAYYSTHTEPSAHKFDTLSGIVGLKNSNKRQRRTDIIKAHERLKTVEFLEDYETTPETIKAHIKPTVGQIRHLIKNKEKPGKK